MHVVSGPLGRGLAPERKWLLAGAAAALAVSVILGILGRSIAGIPGAEASKGQQPWFATASIKRNDDTACCSFYSLSNDRFVSIEHAIDMIMFAYGKQRPLKPAQVLGGPDWMKTEVFNIDAELPKSLWDQVKPLHGAGPGPFPVYPEVSQTDALKQVFRSLLINRFKLQTKHETKVLPVYELVLAKDGPRIAKDETVGRSCRITDTGPGKGLWLDVKCDFATFTSVLSAIPELRSRVLVDKTGLHGDYSFQLHWTPKMPPGMPRPAMGSQRNQSAAPSEPSGPSLLAALRQQLGLKVQSTTAPVDTIVIQQIENPAEN